MGCTAFLGRIPGSRGFGDRLLFQGCAQAGLIKWVRPCARHTTQDVAFKPNSSERHAFPSHSRRGKRQEVGLCTKTFQHIFLCAGVPPRGREKFEIRCPWKPAAQCLSFLVLADSGSRCCGWGVWGWVAPPLAHLILMSTPNLSLAFRVGSLVFPDTLVGTWSFVHLYAIVCTILHHDFTLFQLTTL